MAQQLLEKFVARCEEGRLQEEEAVALLDPTLIHTKVKWEDGGYPYRYSLGVMFINVLRLRYERIPRWRSIVTVLVRNRGIDVDEVEKGGRTLLHHCAVDKDVDFSDLLIHHLGANINVQSKFLRETPLHYASGYNPRSDTVKILLSAPGVDLKMLNKNGKTALDLARDEGAQTIVDLLMAAEQKAEQALPVVQQRVTGRCEACHKSFWRAGGLAVHRCRGPQSPSSVRPECARVAMLDKECCPHHCSVCDRCTRSRSGFVRHNCNLGGRATEGQRAGFQFLCTRCPQPLRYRHRQDFDRHLRFHARQ